MPDITFAGYTFRESALTGRADRGSSIGSERRYTVRKSGVEVEAPANAFAAYLASEGEDPGLYDISADRIAEDWFLLVANYKARKTTYQSFSTTGSTTHLNQSYGTRSSYAASGSAPNYGGAIGVSDSGVAGLDVTVPAFNFQIRKRFKWVSDAYLNAIEELTGSVNSAEFRGRPAGSVLFLGADGGEDDANYVDINYHFAVRKNQTGLVVGSITGISKFGWDYMWVRHREVLVSGLILQVPQFVYIEKVFPEADLNGLSI